MQGAQLSQERDIQAHVDQLPTGQEASVQDATTNTDRIAQLLAKVPQLSLLATAFFAATPILAVANTMSGPKHG